MNYIYENNENGNGLGILNTKTFYTVWEIFVSREVLRRLENYQTFHIRDTSIGQLFSYSRQNFIFLYPLLNEKTHQQRLKQNLCQTLFKKNDNAARNFSATLIRNDDNKLTAFHVYKEARHGMLANITHIWFEISSAYLRRRTCTHIFLIWK